MRKGSPLRLFFEGLLYSNIFIALCAVGSVAYTYAQLGEGFEWSPGVVLIFGGALIVYVLHRWIGYQSQDRITVTLRQELIIAWQPTYGILLLVGSILAAWGFFHLVWPQQWLVIGLGTLALSYVVPFIPFREQWLRLRDLPLIKAPVIALVWAAITLLLVDETWLLGNDWWWLFWQRFFFMLAITLPFDIRDVGVDQSVQLLTLPTYIGVHRSKQISLLLLLCSTGLWYVLPVMVDGYCQSCVLWSDIIVYLLAFRLIYGATSYQSDIYYTFYLDGLTILQGALPFLIERWT